MIKIAIPLLGKRISPRFDHAQGFLLVRAENSKIIDRQEIPTEGCTPLARVRKLSELVINTLICGGIDRTSAQQLSLNGVRIYSWLTGKAEDALRCFLKGRLELVLPGDHIYVKQNGRFYTHHGIYIGEGKVVHLAGAIREKVNPKVHKTDFSRFLKGGKLRRRDYKERLPDCETIRIAKEHLSDKSYSMIWNNCEHFATYCATGKKKSRQVKRVLSGLSTFVGAGVTLYVLTRKV
jgi:predicted Fe-Mo cluster-binding NifX family protein